MKRIVSLVPIMVLVSIVNTVFAKETVTVDGLSNQLDAINLMTATTKDMRDHMLLSCTNIFNSQWKEWLNATKRNGKSNGKTDEELYEEQWDAIKPDFEHCYLVSVLDTVKYAKTYADNECFRYLLGDKKYWASNDTRFTENGDYFFSAKEVEQLPSNLPRFYLLDKEKSFLDDRNRIEQILVSNDIKEVSEIELFAAIDCLAFMYIRSGNNEYLIKIADYVGDGYLPQIEEFKLYPISDVFSSIATISDREGFLYNKGVAFDSALQKKIYINEAGSLNAEGLLKGNEKGLDLLKTLTRAEAVTLLVRALGLDFETSQYKVSSFSDIPSNNWASPYASLARAKGIAYGVSDTEFNPNASVTADQFASFTLRAMGESDFDYTEGLEILIAKGIITEEEAETMDLFTRGDMAKIVYEAKEKNLL